MVLFFAHTSGELLKTKLMKLLNYSDMLFYKENGISISVLSTRTYPANQQERIGKKAWPLQNEHYPSGGTVIFFPTAAGRAICQNAGLSGSRRNPETRGARAIDRSGSEAGAGFAGGAAGFRFPCRGILPFGIFHAERASHGSIRL